MLNRMIRQTLLSHIVYIFYCKFLCFYMAYKWRLFANKYRKGNFAETRVMWSCLGGLLGKTPKILKIENSGSMFVGKTSSGLTGMQAVLLHDSLDVGCICRRSRLRSVSAAPSGNYRWPEFGRKTEVSLRNKFEANLKFIFGPHAFTRRYVVIPWSTVFAFPKFVGSCD